MSKKFVAIVLALVLSFSIVAVPVGAADIEIPAIVENTFYMFLEKMVDFILGYLNKYWPGAQDSWDNVEDFVTENFYPGEDTFDTAVTADSKWSLGFGGASLLEGLNIMDGDYFLAGSLEPIEGRSPTKILDDQRVRCFALSDGVSGTVLYAVIDGFGFSRGDVKEIRSRIADFAAANNVISVNISVLHQHSCIDTLGMNVPLVQALIINTGNNCVDGALDDYKVTKNPVFMENLYEKTVAAMKTAVNTMKEGTLAYGAADITEYIRDKREPISFDGNLNRLRFVPTDGSAETWVLESGIHATSLGAGPDELTADFPYYIEKCVNEKAGANVVFIEGAELAITADKTISNATLPEDASSYDCMVAYGYALGDAAIAITDSIALEPVLNLAMREIKLDVDNEILTLASREEILNADICKSGDGYQMVTEIGYLELGNKVGIFVCPGEFDPGIIYGGVTSAVDSWDGTSWDYAPLKDVSGCEAVMVFGLCNDQAGYVLADNAYHSLFNENEEINVVSRTAGSTFTEGYIALINDVKAAS